MKLFSNNSHISSCGASRLKIVFEELKKNLDCLDAHTNESYFALKQETKSTCWSCYTYNRNVTFLSTETKSALLKKLKSSTILQNTSEQFNFLFLDCIKYIQSEYLKHRESFYCTVSKDRLLFLDRLVILIKLLSAEKDEDRKIKSFVTLVKNLNTIREKKIWESRSFQGTSINHVLKNICLELSYGIFSFIFEKKTAMSAILLDHLSQSLSCLHKSMRSTLRDLDDQTEHHHKELISPCDKFFKKIEQIKEDYDKIALYEISRDQFYSERSLSKPSRRIMNNEKIYLKLELQNQKTGGQKFIYFKIKPVLVSKNEFTKDIFLKYHSTLILNYVVICLWHLKHVNYLKNLCDYAFEQTFAKDPAQKGPLKDPSRSPSPSPSPSRSRSRSTSPSPSRSTSPSPSPSPSTSLSSTCSGVKEFFKTGTSSHFTRLLVKTESSIDYQYGASHVGSYFAHHERNLQKISVFESWIEKLSGSANTIFLDFHCALQRETSYTEIEKNKYLTNSTVLKKNIEDLNKNICLLIKSLKIAHLKAIARSLFVPLENLPNIKEHYFLTIRDCSNDCEQKKCWDFLIDRKQLTPHLKSQLKQEL